MRSLRVSSHGYIIPPSRCLPLPTVSDKTHQGDAQTKRERTSSSCAMSASASMSSLMISGLSAAHAENSAVCSSLSSLSTEAPASSSAAQISARPFSAASARGA